MARTKFRGNLDISPDLKIGVQIFTKSKEENIPSLKKYSKNVPENDNEAAAKISIERTFTEIDDPDQKEVSEDKHAKAFHYGKQLVPVSSENEHVLKGADKPKPVRENQSQEDQIKGTEEVTWKHNEETKHFKLLGFTK